MDEVHGSIWIPEWALGVLMYTSESTVSWGILTGHDELGELGDRELVDWNNWSRVSGGFNGKTGLD